MGGRGGKRREGMEIVAVLYSFLKVGA